MVGVAGRDVTWPYRPGGMEKIMARGIVFCDWGGMMMDEGEKRFKPVEVGERREGGN